MQTVQTTHILTVGTSLPTETLRIGAILDRQLLLIQNHVTVDIGHGHLCGRDQVKVIHLAVIHLSLLVGQLTCAIAGSGIHHRRRHDLGIACVACLVEEEIDQRPLQTCALSLIDGETGTGDLHTQVEINQVILLRQLPVGQCVLGQLSLHATHLLHHVVLGRSTFGHLLIRDIRDGIEQGLQIGCGLIHLGLERLAGLLDLGYTLLSGLGLLFLSGLHQLTDRLGCGVDLRQVLI